MTREGAGRNRAVKPSFGPAFLSSTLSRFSISIPESFAILSSSLVA